MKAALLVAVIALAAALATVAAGAAGVDLHRLWDDRCAGCHGHAGAFAREHLRVEDGRLLGRHERRDLRTFLRNHHPRAGDVEAIHSMLMAQAGTEARFERRCGACHGAASAFVRDSLERRDGVLRGRSSGESVASFLVGHRGLDEPDAAFFSGVLERIESEVRRR